MSSKAFCETPVSSKWKGAYLGGFMGGAFGNYNAHTNVGTISDISYFSSEDNINAVNKSGTKTLSTTSFIVGIKGGDDWSWKNFVFGVGLDYGFFRQKSHIDVTQAYPDGSGNYSLSLELKTNWLLTLRGRLGWVFFDTKLPTLLYATGGLALTNVLVSNNFSDDSLLLGVGSSAISGNKIGWTVGGGVELAVIKYLGVYAEYLYVNIPTLATNGRISNSAEGFGISENSFSSSFSSKAYLSTNLIRFGVNYRFGT